jgi:hypothetical protein
MQQPNTFSSSAESGPAATHDDDAAGAPKLEPRPASSKPRRPRRLIRGLMALEFLLAVMVRIFIGVILVFMPWYPPVWDNNQLLHPYPHLAIWLSYGAVRGIISGLGLLNLWIAIDDTLHRGERHV